MSIDRTHEFFTAAEAVRRRTRGDFPVAKPSRTPTERASDFAARASECSRRIQQTSMKLGQLTKHVRRQGLLHDPTASINKLTSSIKLDIVTLNKQIAELASLQQCTLCSARPRLRAEGARRSLRLVPLPLPPPSSSAITHTYSTHSFALSIPPHRSFAPAIERLIAGALAHGPSSGAAAGRVDGRNSLIRERFEGPKRAVAGAAG